MFADKANLQNEVLIGGPLSHSVNVVCLFFFVTYARPKLFAEFEPSTFFWGNILSHVRPFYERAVSNLDP
jgi:hypothetical protein